MIYGARLDMVAILHSGIGLDWGFEDFDCFVWADDLQKFHLGSRNSVFCSARSVHE